MRDQYYFANIASHPVIARRTPASRSYCFVRTKTVILLAPKYRRRIPGLTHHGSGWIDSPEDSGVLYDIVDTSGQHEQ